MFGNNMRLGLSRDLVIRMVRVQAFFERLKMNADEEFMASIAVACFNDLLLEAGNGRAVYGYDGVTLLPISCEDVTDIVFGKSFDTWHLTNIPADMVTICHDITRTLQSDSVEDAVRWCLYFLSCMVEFLETDYVLVLGRPVNEEDITIEYWEQPVFEDFRPGRVQ